MEEKQAAPERRRRNRLSITVPVQVRGRGPDGTAWEEVASSLDASEGGLALVLSRPLGAGQIVHLSMPLPRRLRRHDYSASFYRVYGLVRDSRPLDARSRVGVMFLGQNPPRNGEPLPSEAYRLPGDGAHDAEAAPQPATSLLLRLEAAEAPGGLVQEEETTVERLTPATAVVTVRRLPVSRGTVLTLEEVGGSFRCRAEVTIISIDDAGLARLVLAVLHGSIPQRLLPGGPPTAH